MKKILKMMKVLMINSIIFSLIQHPLINKANANDILDIANMSLGFYGSYLGQKQQIIQMQINSANNQRLMSEMGPNCRKPDGTACYFTPAKFFPECVLPASMASMPQNICNNPSPEPGQISTMITYEAISKGWINYYDQMSNEADNSNYAVGLRCLGDKQKAMDSQLTEMVNNLQRLQDKMNQEKQIFRDNNKKLLEDMNDANDELFGANKKNLKIKTQDFAKFFSQSCQSVIGADNLKSGTGKGFNGILQDLSSTNKSAADFNLNKNIIEDDVRREAGKITSAINAGGVDDWLNNSNTASSITSKNFPAIEAAVKKQAVELNTARARIKKELDAVNYTPPPMDKNFSVDMADFNSGAEDFFKKKYVNDCVTGASSGIAIPVEDILKSLQQKSTNNAGTARNDYRAALKKILDSDSMMDEKMAAIKDLQNKFPDITITYKDSSQARITENPYDLFMKTIDKCQQRYAQDDQFSSRGSSGVAYQKKVERARAALLELKNLNDSFSSKVTQSITEQVLNCNGEAIKSGSASCNEDSLKTTSDNFCVSHASTCASNIQSCYAEANNQVLARKSKMENLSRVFNANVGQMIARSNALYEQQKLAVTNITKLIQAKFPGTNFEIPKDMFVPMPEMLKDKYGVEMAGDGDMKSFLDGPNSMPEKIEKLKKMFQMQKEAVKQSIAEYIDLQRAAMEKEKGRWAELANQCKGAIDSSQRGLAKSNEEGMKAQNEMDAKVSKFCKKYNSISDNPVGGCSKAKDLADISDQIASRLSNQALILTEKYASVCDGYNNESDEISQQDCDGLTGTALRNCNRANGIALDNADKRAGASSGASKGKSISYYSICGLSSDPNSDEIFIKNVIENLNEQDQKTLAGATSLKDIIPSLKKLNDPEIFADIDSLITSAKPEATVSAEETPKYVKQSREYAALNGGENNMKEEYIYKVSSSGKKEKIARKVFDIDPYELRELEVDGKPWSASDSSTNVLKEQFDSLEKQMNTAPAPAPAAAANICSNIKDKPKLDAFLSDLGNIKNPKLSNSNDLKFSNVENIGQQMTGPCDMQNNSNLIKNMGSDFMTNFDQTILGTSR